MYEEGKMSFEILLSNGSKSSFVRAAGPVEPGRPGGHAPPPDFPRFNTVEIDQTLKPIKVFQ